MQHPQYKIIDRDSLFRSNLASVKQSANQIPTRLNLATLKQPPTGHHNSHTTQLSVLSFRKGPSRATQEFLSRELCRMSHFYFWELSRYHYTLNDPWGICRREQRPNRRVHAASPPQPSPANESWHGWKKVQEWDAPEVLQWYGAKARDILPAVMFFVAILCTYFPGGLTVRK